VLIRTDPYAELSTGPSFKDDLDVDDIRIFQDRPTYQKRHGDGSGTLRSYTKSIKRSATVSKLAEHYKAQGLDRHWFWKYRMAVAEAYANPRTQTIVAGLICANFVAQCFQRQLDPVNQGDPPADHRGQLWATIANFFNVVFLIELLINLYGTWYWPGWLFGSDLSAWNRFDCVIVFLGVVDLCNFPYPGQLKLLRMLRVFRVFRLFHRVESLQKIMHALLEAVPGVLNAGVILFIILFIYSVLAVDLFNRVYYNGKDKRENCDGEGSTHGRTPRHDLCYGWEYYGTFVQASYSLFQIMSGDSWSEMGVRPVLQWFYEKDGKGMDGDVVYKLERLGIMLFFLSFVLLTTFVLMNVVVTILLDKYSSEMSKNAELEAVAQLERMEDHFVRLEQSVNDHLRELTDVINDLASELSRVRSRGLQPTT
jgi:hypothetical protein